MRAPVALALVLALLLPGCALPLQPGATTESAGAALAPLARFEELPGESVWIEASADGTPLHLRLFLPETASEPEWRAPTVLVMSPYFGDDAREDPDDTASKPTYFRYRWLIEHFVPRGYAVAFADVRGTGDSGGCLEQTAQLQWQDGYDTVEWLAAQPWSNGKVGMFGKSYDAETQQSTAIMAPPSLATIVPVASVSGQYEYGFYDGVPLSGIGPVGKSFLSNVGYMQSDGLQVPRSQEGLMAYPTRAGCHPGMLAQGADTSGDWSDFWEEREIRHHAEKVQASVLYVHGLQDWNVRPVAIRDWLSEIPSEKRAILGQWAHDYPEENRYVPDWSRPDWRPIVEAWYDHYLLGVENGMPDALPPVSVQDSSGVWRAEAAFPPTDARDLVLALSDDGALAASGTLSAPVSFAEDAPGFLQHTLLDGAPPSSIAFESAPFERDLLFSGWPTLDLTVALDRDDAHFAANLYDVAPDGKATWINAGYLSARHREGVDQPSAVPSGEQAYVLRFHPADTLVPAGHALRLTLSAADGWGTPQGNGFTATVSAGALHVPEVVRDMEAVRLDVTLGEPIPE